MFIFFYLIINVQSYRIRQIINESLEFQIPTQEETLLLSLFQAKDSKLITNETLPFCHLRELNLIFDTRRQHFENIVTMVHVRDGVLFITSDYFLYLIKFNYQNFSGEFAKTIWKADFKELGLDTMAEMPQLLYCSMSNLGILFQTRGAVLFSVQQMEQKVAKLQIKDLIDIKQRNERGVTKEYDNYIFSCVGENGLDVYKITGNELHYVDQISDTRFKDLAILKIDHLIYLILLDEDQSCISVYQMDVVIIKISLKLQYKFPTIQQEFVAIDNYKNNIFVVYEYHHKYICVEYYFTERELVELNSFETYSKIKDVDVSEQFAILQGQNKHHIMFVTKFDGLQIQYVPQYTLLGAIDIDFFYLTNIDLTMSHLTDSNNFSMENFFFGTSKSGLFFTKFKFQDPYIICYPPKNQKNTQQYYQIIQNETSNLLNNIQNNFIFQRYTNITILAYDDGEPSYQKLIVYLGIPICISVLLMGICVWFISKNKEIERLETEISTIKNWLMVKSLTHPKSYN
ncbi:unnamed protein product (macronuclear) [Paramecium tetraurelia]|uniref:Transmembrane protein n=1 Tax=Paramecium tetraurelia TaxID=5888 RepID=A0DNK9_PARTE|nr:uncharacterized protein GSPATT00018822001 [Paramecium tetraurelia]CAK84626.1 unnamed protein product [Paramecium tetraurelia]|eukprot:XP_001452023.1 hypothetical protein (macronuclear) [Paramecium tetraurelia strain d4-2]